MEHFEEKEKGGAKENDMQIERKSKKRNDKVVNNQDNREKGEW